MRTAAAIAVGIAVAMFTSALAIGLRAPLAATSLRGLAIWTALVQTADDRSRGVVGCPDNERPPSKGGRRE